MLAACLLAAAIAVHDLASLFIPDRYTPRILLVGFAVVARGGGFRRAGLAHRAGGALLFLVCLFDVAHRRLRGRAGFGDNKLIGVSAVLVGLAASAPRSYLPRSRLSSSASSAPCGSILNTAELIGALRAAGAAPGTAHDLASKISGHRAGPTPPNGQPTGSAPPKAENDTKLFQTVSESAAFPGITPDMAIAIEPYCHRFLRLGQRSPGSAR